MIGMMIAAAIGGSAIDAERAFARDAQRIGQWAAFRKWAGQDAVMFVPQTVWARDLLKGRKDPPRAMSWSPAESFTSCDGAVAINSGPWHIPGAKAQGRFTTIWLKKRLGWHWTYDGAEPLAEAPAAPAQPRSLRASCSGRPTGAPISHAPPLVRRPGPTPDDTGRGESGDRTLGWDWQVAKTGVRSFRVFQWTGHGYRQVVDQHIAAK